MRANFASQVKKGKMSQPQLEGLINKLHGTVTYDDFKSVDMVCLLTSKCLHFGWCSTHQTPRLPVHHDQLAAASILRSVVANQNSLPHSLYYRTG